MKKLLEYIVQRAMPLITVMFVLLGTQVTAQDFDKGLEAYDNKDYTSAYREWMPLAVKGDADAQRNIGMLTAAGFGVEQDNAEALKWFRLSAEQGDGGAQANLGMMYQYGHGVPQDNKIAVKWYRKVAEQGGFWGHEALGSMYEYGKGVLKDNSLAHMWYNISSANGSLTAGDSRDKLGATMKAGAIEKATAMARKCMKSEYKKCGY